MKINVFRACIVTALFSISIIGVANTLNWGIIEASAQPVNPTFVLVSNVTTLDVKSFIKLTGTLNPPKTGRVVLNWAINASGFIYNRNETITNGLYTREFGFSSGTGVWQIRVIWPGDATSTPITSNAVTITVTSSPTPTPSTDSQVYATVWVPPPENAAAATVAATIATGGVSILFAAALVPSGLPTDKVTQRISDLLPDSLKSWLEALMSSKLKHAVDEKTGSPLVPTKSEVMAYITSVLVLGFSFSYVKADTLSQILLILPVIIGTSILVGFVKTIILIVYARLRGVWTENKLWYLGLVTFLVTTFLFRVPFSSPSRIVRYESKITKRLDAILSSVDIVISLAFAGGFYLLLRGGYPAIGSVGLAMCIIGAFFDSLPISPLNGRTIFSYNKLLWGAVFGGTLILYASWLLLM
jgi:hypothetical protein